MNDPIIENEADREIGDAAPPPSTQKEERPPERFGVNLNVVETRDMTGLRTSPRLRRLMRKQDDPEPQES